MYKRLSYQIINTFSCQSSSILLLLELCRNHYERESISVGGCEQRGDPLFEFMQDRLVQTYLC